MGVSDGCSILDIINALPAKSLFLYHEQYNGATINDMPPNYRNGGIIRILNIGGRYEIDFRRQNANSLLSPPEHYIGSVAASNPTSIEWSKNLTNADIKVQTGSVSVRPAQNSTVSFEVIFPEPFSEVPNVSLSPITTIPGDNSVSPGQITTTKFVGYIYRSAAVSANMTIRWTAAGK